MPNRKCILHDIAHDAYLLHVRAHFISSPLRVFDFAVVVVSLALEISLRSDPEGGLLIIARVW